MFRDSSSLSEADWTATVSDKRLTAFMREALKYLETPAGVLDFLTGVVGQHSDVASFNVYVYMSYLQQDMKVS